VAASQLNVTLCIHQLSQQSSARKRREKHGSYQPQPGSLSPERSRLRELKEGEKMASCG